jgi:hypothetical protein
VVNNAAGVPLPSNAATAAGTGSASATTAGSSIVSNGTAVSDPNSPAASAINSGTASASKNATTGSKDTTENVIPAKPDAAAVDGSVIPAQPDAAAPEGKVLSAQPRVDAPEVDAVYKQHKQLDSTAPHVDGAPAKPYVDAVPTKPHVYAPEGDAIPTKPYTAAPFPTQQTNADETRMAVKPLNIEIARPEGAIQLPEGARNEVEAPRAQLEPSLWLEELKTKREVQLTPEQAARLQAQYPDADYDVPVRGRAESSQSSELRDTAQNPPIVFTVPTGQASSVAENSNGIHVAVGTNVPEDRSVIGSTERFSDNHIVVGKTTAAEIGSAVNNLPVVETIPGDQFSQPTLKSDGLGEAVTPSRNYSESGAQNIYNPTGAQNVDSVAISGKGDVVSSKADFESIDSKTNVPVSGITDWLNDATSKYGYSSNLGSANATDSLHSYQSNVPRESDFSAPTGALAPNALGDSLSGSSGARGLPESLDPNNVNLGANGTSNHGPVDPNAANLGVSGIFDPNAINPVSTNSGSLTDSLIGVDGKPVSNTSNSQADGPASSGSTKVPDWLEQATQNLGLSTVEVKANNPDKSVLEPEGERRQIVSSDSGIVSPASAPTTDSVYQSDRVDSGVYGNPIVGGDSNAVNNSDYGTISNINAAGNDYGILAADQHNAAEQERIQRIMDEQARNERDAEQERLTRLDDATAQREAELRLSQDELEKVRRREEDENRRKKEGEERIDKAEEKRHSDEILTVIALRQQAEAEAKVAAQRLAEERQLAQEIVRKDNLQEKYVVQPNDTIIKIALRKFKDVRLVDLIYELNKGKIEVRWEGGKRVYIVKPGAVLIMPSAKQVREWTARLNNVGSRTSQQGLEARSSVAADQRRANIEKVLGTIREAVDGGSEKSYSVRLGDTLRSIAMRHPDLHDVTLWPLLAKKNGLSTDMDSKGAPLAVVIRGANIVIPTREEIEMFRSNTAELKPVAREPQTYVGAYGSLFNVATKPCGGCRRLISENANLCPACGYVFGLQEEPSIESQATTFSMPNGDTTLSLPEHTVVVKNYEEQTTVVDFQQTTLSLPEQSRSNDSASAKNDTVHTGNTGNAGKSTGSNSNSRAIDSYVTGGHSSPVSAKSGSANTGSGTGNTGSGVSSNLAHRTLDERENAAELSRRVETLNDNCRLVKTEKEFEGMHFVCQQLQVLIDGDWTPVLSYEVGSESSVRHEYHKDGRKKTIKIDLPSGAVGEMVSNELTSNWLDYCQRYLAGRKLSA